jgi:hypothetical protein
MIKPLGGFVFYAKKVKGHPVYFLKMERFSLQIENNVLKLKKR